MGFLGKMVGYADVGLDATLIEEYLSEDEEVIQSFEFLRDAVILTNYGIYTVDVQGVTGQKKEVKFYPKKSISSISFETAGTLDIDVDIKIGVVNNHMTMIEGELIRQPIEFKVPSSQTKEAKEEIQLVKQYYLHD